MFQGLVEQYITGRCVGFENDFSRAQTLPSHTGSLQFDTPAKAQLNQDTSSQPARYAIVPE